jgi:HK97 family phage prohead protease
MTGKTTNGGHAAPVSSGETIRSFHGALRSGAERKIKGYPILFNELSQDLGGFRERILPDAISFDPDIRADFNHSPDFILGRRAAGTLKLTIDARGVHMEADPPHTTWADDLLISMDRGDIDQGSFAFRVLPGGQQTTEENGETVRTLSKILVRRVSVVSDPAYTGTSVQVRNRTNASKQPEARITLLRMESGDVAELRKRRQRLLEAEL